MAALSAARNTPCMDARLVKLVWPVKGSTTIYEGSQVALNAGYLAPAATATGLIGVGTAAQTIVNAGADGAATCEAWISISKWDNKSTDLVVAADVGATCYMYDDNTVNHTSTGASSAGKAIQLDSDSVWVA